MNRLSERLATKIQVDSETGCWLWTAYVNPSGYGEASQDGRMRGAHRVVYEAMRGPIPASMFLDHQCHNRDRSCRGGRRCPHRRCVNPAHLEPTTNVDNIRRGRAGEVTRDRLRAQTHCKHGHPLSGANVLRDARGYRFCRACARIKARRHVGDRPTTRRRGPLRLAVSHSGRRSLLECGHEVIRDSGNRPKRLRCVPCDPDNQVSDLPSSENVTGSVPNDD